MMRSLKNFLKKMAKNASLKKMAKEPKRCKICNSPKSSVSFGQWVVYDGEGKNGYHTAQRKKICLVCEKKLKAKFGVDNLSIDRQIKLRLAEKQIENAVETAIKIEEEKKLPLQPARKPNPKVTRRSKSDIEKELLERELSKKSLVEFIKRFNPNYMAGWVHEDICRRLAKFLKAIQDGRSPRLMLFMPPRHGKSMIASHHFPAWALGHVPELEIIAASYGSSLPMKFSRQVRSFLRDKRYQVLFPKAVLDRTNENVEGWSTTKGGGYIPAGVGGGITGKGAHLFIVDDPVKDAEEADSETIRNNTWDWWGSTAYTRLAPNAGVLVIQTRWHDDDLSGRMIQQMKEELKELDELTEVWRQDGAFEEDIQNKRALALCEIDQWEIIEYPAISHQDEWLNLDGTVTTDPADSRSKFLRPKGSALHPERFDHTRLMKIKRTLQPRHWSALYQQNPVPDEGMYFLKSMFRYQQLPRFGSFPICIAWDLAIGQKQQNDYTVGAVGCLDYHDNLWVLEVLRGKWDTHQIADIILNTYYKYNTQTTGSVMVGIEKGQLELAIKPHLNRLMKKRRLYPNFDEELKPLTDKLVRARPLQGRMQQGMVIFPSETTHPWVEDVRHELLRFPGGVHDDIVDALSWLARMFANISPPQISKPKKQKSWRDKLKEHVDQGSRHPMTA